MGSFGDNQIRSKTKVIKTKNFAKKLGLDVATSSFDLRNIPTQIRLIEKAQERGYIFVQFIEDGMVIEA